ncbi:MAG: aspartate 1-decarboxylase [Pirellulales bacterium]|nr:aspartate 1-decarboxylase [Pirellulales bacterium]
MLKSKIHRATVTEANVEYEGSISIDSNLMTAADIIPFEAVQVWNVTRGTRLETYAIEAPPSSGVICINGAAAHLVAAGEIVIIASFVDVPDKDAPYSPKLIFVDAQNRQCSAPV